MNILKPLVMAILCASIPSYPMQMALDDDNDNVYCQFKTPEDMMNYACSLESGRAPYRASFKQAFQNTPFLSDTFKSNVLSRIYSTQFKHGDGARSVAFNHLALNHDGTQLATGSDKHARIFNANTGQCIHLLPHGDWVRSVAFNHDGSQLATGSDKHARIFDTDTGQCIHLLPHGDWVRSVAFNHDGTQLATGSADKHARIFDTDTGQRIHSLKHGNWVYSVAFNHDGSLLATGSADKHARIFDTDTGQRIHALPHSNSVFSVAFNHDGSQLATGSDDRHARIWKLAALKRAHEIFALPESMPQLRLLQACEVALQENTYVHPNDEQMKTFNALPERMQNALRRFIVSGIRR